MSNTKVNTNQRELSESGFEKTTLSNGIRILTESHNDSRCVVVGVWALSGTRDEPASSVGVSHFVEHMVFKGTKKYNSLEIARSLEAVGGEINAYTSREYTCYHTASLREDLDMSLDVLTELYFKAKFEEKEIEREKKVVQQEILMCADSTEDYIFDCYFESAFGEHTLSYPILGSLDSISNMDRKQSVDYYQAKYLPNNLIITVCGSIDHNEVVAWAKEKLGHYKPADLKQKRTSPTLPKVHELVARDNEQTHLLLGLPSVSFHSPERFEAIVVNTLLGGGMTSTLYQEIRENRGLAYSVFSMLNTFTDTGLLNIYAGTEEEYVPEIYDLVVKELSRLRKDGVSTSELAQFKQQVRGNIIMAAEDIESRMSSIGTNEMVFGEYRSVESVVDEITKLNTDKVNAYIEKYLNPDDLGVFVMGAAREASINTWFDNL